MHYAHACPSDICKNNVPESLTQHLAWLYHRPPPPETHPTNSVLEASTSKPSQLMNCVNVEFMSNIADLSVAMSDVAMHCI